MEVVIKLNNHMKTKLLTLLIIIIAFASCKKQNDDFSTQKTAVTTSKAENEEAQILFQQKCYACHSVITKSHDEIIAPPMIAVKKRYSMQFDNKEDFVKAVVAYAGHPDAKNALMTGAISKFKAMPMQNFREEDLTKIATYIYENEIETPVWFQDHFKQNHKNGMGMGQGMGKNKNTN